MKLHTSTLTGRQIARTRWDTHASAEAFDRKKSDFLTPQAQSFITQQTQCVIAGPGLDYELCGTLTFGRPGFAEAPDQQTCLLHLDKHATSSYLINAITQLLHDGQEVRLGMFFISHPTRERLCVQGTAQLLPGKRTIFSFWRTQPTVTLQLSVHEAFFHCAKYIKTRIPGLTLPAHRSYPQHYQLLPGSYIQLTRPMRYFIKQQRLCFLCTINRDGQCAINHRGGATGFLVALPPHANAPKGAVLLPDYEGNGAFEAIGNIFETGLATLLIPNYVQQRALCLAGQAQVQDIADIPREMVQLFVGAKRVIKLDVQHAEVQQGNWSRALASEQARAQRIWAMNTQNTQNAQHVEGCKL